MARGLTKIETDSHGSMCLEDYKYMCMHPLPLDDEYTFLNYFMENSNGFPVNAMFDLQWTSGLNMIYFYKQEDTHMKTALMFEETFFSSIKMKLVWTG